VFLKCVVYVALNIFFTSLPNYSIIPEFWHCNIFTMFEAYIYIPIFHKYLIMTYSSDLCIVVKKHFDPKEIRMHIFTQIRTSCTHISYFLTCFHRLVPCYNEDWRDLYSYT
jgi:hypothetical protein